MKFRNIIINTFLCALAVNMVACQKQDHAYEQFVKDGERIYIGKVVEVVAKPGKGRVGLSWGVFDSRAKKIKIKYNDGLDSIMLDVSKTESVDYMDVVINNLQERLYSFQIYTLDGYGNQSVARTIDCQSYGENYRKTLNNRFISSAVKSGKNLNMNWLSSKSPVVETEIEYFDATTGESKVVKLPVATNTITLTNVKFDQGLRYRTKYSPTDNALDYFYSDYSTFKIN